MYCRRVSIERGRRAARPSFLQLAGHPLRWQLLSELARSDRQVRELTDALEKPLRPEAVRFVAELPKTRNTKVMRRIIRAACLGKDPGDISALENPDAVEAIRVATEEI